MKASLLWEQWQQGSGYIASFLLPEKELVQPEHFSEMSGFSEVYLQTTEKEQYLTSSKGKSVSFLIITLYGKFQLLFQFFQFLILQNNLWNIAWTSYILSFYWFLCILNTLSASSKLN